MDKNNKILALIGHGKDGSVDEVTRFLEDAIAVKLNYIKTGDIGGVIYVSPTTFSDEAMNYFYQKTTEKKKQVGIAMLDSFTGYKGFVRVGKNRGFHLNLILESDNGYRVIGPVL